MDEFLKMLGIKQGDLFGNLFAMVKEKFDFDLGGILGPILSMFGIDIGTATNNTVASNDADNNANSDMPATTADTPPNPDPASTASINTPSLSAQFTANAQPSASNSNAGTGLAASFNPASSGTQTQSPPAPGTHNVVPPPAVIPAGPGV